MEPHEERVVTEQRDLNEKIKKLRVFVKGEVCRGLPRKDQILLHRQLNVMFKYYDILALRIARFVS